MPKIALDMINTQSVIVSTLDEYKDEVKAKFGEVEYNMATLTTNMENEMSQLISNHCLLQANIEHELLLQEVENTIAHEQLIAYINASWFIKHIKRKREELFNNVKLKVFEEYKEKN